MDRADLAELHGEEWSLVLERGADGAPLWRHFGARLDPGAIPAAASLRGKSTFSPDEDPPMALAPTDALGWLGVPALAMRNSAGSWLPVCFGNHAVEIGRDALVAILEDRQSGITLTVRFEKHVGGGLVIATELANHSGEPVLLDRLASAHLPLFDEAHEIVSWRGRHNSEFEECREALPAHSWVREARGGLTGHGGPPGCYALGEQAGHDAGHVLAAQLAWSGDSRVSIERDRSGERHLVLEAVFQPGETVIAPGETFAAPDVLLAFSRQGRNGAMQQQHAMVRSRIDWPGASMGPRPVHLNSWEACYFAHDEARIEALAKAAAAIGVERFVLDDGWFKGRSSDRAGLGDWTADPGKYPQGLGPIASRVTGLGMQFGLWVEPEMVNPDSDLYRAHPDWALALPGRDRPTARNQLVLDMRREEVRDYLFASLDALLGELPIAYLKWDHNRFHAPAGGAAQTRGTYALLERLRAAHPQVEIESCAAGGGRIDAGIAAFTHRFWASDNIDALSRIAIQRGFLTFMPPEMMGAHVGASPSHATGRHQSLDYRAAIACQGHFGIELDPDALSDGERKNLAGWIGFYKDWRHLIHGGEVLLGSGRDGLVWQAQGTDEDYLLWAIRQDHPADRLPHPLRLPFAGGRHEWEVSLLRTAGARGVLTGQDAAIVQAMKDAPVRWSGSWLAENGLPLPALAAESTAIYHLKATG